MYLYTVHVCISKLLYTNSLTTLAHALGTPHRKKKNNFGQNDELIG